MRRSWLGMMVVAVGTVAIGGGEARAQFGNASNDPISLYYGIYLPRQQAQALQPGPEAALNALSAQRQAYAATNRNDAFDPQISRFDVDGSEYGFNSGNRQPGGTMAAARIGQNLNGMGPSKYFGGAKLKAFHPNIPTGLKANANIGQTRQRGRFSGGGGYGGVGLPGPR